MNLSDRKFVQEFEFITSRSSGKGGQHVNKTDSKVELRFNIQRSEVLNEEEKKLLAIKLAGRINKEGILQIVSQKFRSQLKNKKSCIKKFYEIIEEGLKIPKERKKRKRSAVKNKKRLEEKQKQSEKKDRRKKDFI